MLVGVECSSTSVLYILMGDALVPSARCIFLVTMGWISPVFAFLLVVLMVDGIRRYFLRKLKKVKKSNGQVLAINEVPVQTLLEFLILLPGFGFLVSLH